MTDIPVQATRADLARRAREHYEFVSRIACAWSNVIPECIDAWEREPGLQAAADVAGAMRVRLDELTTRAEKAEQELAEYKNGLPRLRVRFVDPADLDLVADEMHAKARAEKAEAQVARLRAAVKACAEYFRVKKSWDSRLPELQIAKAAIDAALAALEGKTK